MAFIGTPLDTRNTFQSLQGKRFSGDGSTTAFTLDVAPSSTLDIEVFVENVRQDPNSAYTLSGTTLTFTGAPPSGTNNIYVVHQAKAVGTIDVPATYKSEAQTISGARTFNGGITMGGTTPTLTIGDAGAEDTKIVFDGNAQDFYMGLDDSADDLIIGLGSAVGTTPAISITEALKTQFGGAAVAKTITDATNTGNVTLDYDAGQNFVLTFTGNVTLVNPTTESVGQTGIIVIIQDGTGSRTLSVGTDYEFPAGTAPTISTGANTTDIIPYCVIAANRVALGAPQLAFA